jgi:hypothetical protein
VAGSAIVVWESRLHYIVSVSAHEVVDHGHDAMFLIDIGNPAGRYDAKTADGVESAFFIRLHS